MSSCPQRQKRGALTPAPRRPQAAPMARAQKARLMPTGANRPLAGIVVLDFGQVYQGPYATLLMAKAGADVIKIEPPQGEPLRRRAPPGKSTTFPIAMLDRRLRAHATYPFKFYNVLGNAITKHIFANGQPVADIISATSSSSSAITFDASSTSITTGFNAGPVTKSWTQACNSCSLIAKKTLS
jgi:hypothetical protein